ncbi:MAG: hypothetical protein IID61_08210 [SAR324 cluster bacterium]|nr:hypothetical protein [SAR324 cluster bacterium]
MEQNKVQEDLNLAIQNPDLVSTIRMQELQDTNMGLENTINLLKDYLANQRIVVRDLKSRSNNASDSVTELKQRGYELRNEISRIFSNKTVIVKSRGQCIITENISPIKCKEQAMKNAEQQAIEFGGESIINSTTEVVNFQITRDEIIRKIDARIIRKEFNIKFVRGQDDREEYGRYEVNLIAAVKNNPKVSESEYVKKVEPQKEKQIVKVKIQNITYTKAQESWQKGKINALWTTSLAALSGFIYADVTQNSNEEQKRLRDSGATDVEIRAEKKNGESSKSISDLSYLVAAGALVVYLYLRANEPVPDDYERYSFIIPDIRYASGFVGMVFQWKF